MRAAKSIKKQLSQIIVQGNNDEIVEISFKEFCEDNCPTLASFLVSNLYNSFLSYTQTRVDKKLLKNKFELDEFIKNVMIEEIEELFLKIKKRQTKYVSN